MLFEKWLLPDTVLPGYQSLSPEMLLKLGKKGLICDIDNTLATYDDADPPEAVRDWCRRMQDSGIAVAFVSNNHVARVSRFAKDLDVKAFADSGKPSGKGLARAMAAMGTDPSTTAAIGDQLLTDVLAAKRSGLYAVFVPPIKDKTNLFFRFKRWLEKPYLRRYAALHAEEKKEKEEHV